MRAYLTQQQMRDINNASPINQNVQLGTLIGNALNGLLPAGDVWYVSRNVAGSGDGKSWETAFATITEAINQVNADYAAAQTPSKGRNTIIYIGEGWYSEVPMTLTANDCHIIGTAPGYHDPVVLYGSATAGGWDIGAGAPALTIEGDNNTVENVGFFVYDNTMPALRIGNNAGGGGAVTTTGTKILNCSFVRDVADGEKYGIESFGADGTLIAGCFFSTSCKDAGIWVGTNGVINPVNTIIRNCKFIGSPIALLNAASAHTTIFENNTVVDDTSDRPDTVDVPISNTGGLNLIATNNYWEFSEANAITGAGDHLMVNNFQLAAT
jgi:hypothetical protein